MIRVLLVHEARLLRSALAALLGREKDLEVTTACWKSAAASARSLRPDVCVADVDHPGAGSLVAAAELPQLTALSQEWRGRALELAVLQEGRAHR